MRQATVRVPTAEILALGEHELPSIFRGFPQNWIASLLHVLANWIIINHHSTIYIYTYIYRVFHDLWTLLQEVIS